MSAELILFRVGTCDRFFVSGVKELEVPKTVIMELQSFVGYGELLD